MKCALLQMGGAVQGAAQARIWLLAGRCAALPQIWEDPLNILRQLDLSSWCSVQRHGVIHVASLAGIDERAKEFLKPATELFLAPLGPLACMPE